MNKLPGDAAIPPRQKARDTRVSRRPPTKTMQEKKALSSRGRGRLRGFLELRRPGGVSPEAPAACSFPGENARRWEALGEARPGQSTTRMET